MQNQFRDLRGKTMKGLLFASMLALTFTVNAEITEDLVRCGQIDSEEDRLDCFDTVTNYYKNAPKQPAATKNNNATFGQQKREDGQLESLNSVAAYYNKQKRTVTTSLEDNFGKKRPDEELESLKSSIVGEFKGWRKGKIILLANGQKWKVLHKMKGYANLMNPEVEITRGMLGSFMMKVEGVYAKAKVTRVK